MTSSRTGSDHVIRPKPRHHRAARKPTTDHGVGTGLVSTVSHSEYTPSPASNHGHAPGGSAPPIPKPPKPVKTPTPKVPKPRTTLTDPLTGKPSSKPAAPKPAHHVHTHAHLVAPKHTGLIEPLTGRHSTQTPADAHTTFAEEVASNKSPYTTIYGAYGGTHGAKPPKGAIYYPKSRMWVMPDPATSSPPSPTGGHHVSNPPTPPLLPLSALIGSNSATPRSHAYPFVSPQKAR
jgi:hypothetical protein